MVDNKTTSDTTTSTDNKEGATEEKQEFVTSVQLNNAITGRLKAQEKVISELKDAISKLSLSTQQTQEEVKKPSEVSQLKAAVEQMKKEKQEEVQKRLDFELRNTVKDELTSLGVKPSLLKPIMAQMIDADKIIAFSEEGKIIYKTQYGEEDLKTALKTWSKSNEAKDFIQGVNAKGTGDKQPRNTLVRDYGDNEADETLKNFFGLK